MLLEEHTDLRGRPDQNGDEAIAVADEPLTEPSPDRQSRCPHRHFGRRYLKGQSELRVEVKQTPGDAQSCFYSAADGGTFFLQC